MKTAVIGAAVLAATTVYADNPPSWLDVNHATENLLRIEVDKPWPSGIALDGEEAEAGMAYAKQHCDRYGKTPELMFGGFIGKNDGHMQFRCKESTPCKRDKKGDVQ